ncbi:hypothetical protein HaLaN_31522, partial [Haematococcus lacustris]
MLVHCLGRLHYDDPPTPLVYSTLALHSLRHKLPLSLISNVLWAYGQLATSNVLFAQSLSTPAMCTLVLAAEQQLREARQKLGDLGLAVGLSEPKRWRTGGGLVTVLLDFVRGVAEQATTSDSQVIGNVARACMRLRLKSPELLTCISQLLPGLLPQLTDQDIGSVATSCACLYS